MEKVYEHSFGSWNDLHTKSPIESPAGQKRSLDDQRPGLGGREMSNVRGTITPVLVAQAVEEGQDELGAKEREAALRDFADFVEKQQALRYPTSKPATEVPESPRTPNNKEEQQEELDILDSLTPNDGVPQVPLRELLLASVRRIPRHPEQNEYDHRDDDNQEGLQGSHAQILRHPPGSAPRRW
ncbi:P-loop containing nucleoside triphosphate hydrolase protein [Apiospora marii]|uniref:P-loop containing nucleoside triphosphate hydrolase protein n=1 Tax=Apiospora marii TaxID=335849 RepID=A0ABR1R144_9PEZI